MKDYDAKVQSNIDKLHKSKQRQQGKRIISLICSVSKEDKATLLIQLGCKK